MSSSSVSASNAASSGQALNIASFSLTVVSLITLFETCMRGCTFVAKTTTSSRRSLVTLSKFEIETWRLAIWGRIWGLVDSSTHDSRERYLNILDIRRIVGSCLVSIRGIVGDMQVLEQKYGLETRPSPSGSLNDTPSALPNAFQDNTPLDHSAIVDAYSRWLSESVEKQQEFSLAKKLTFTFRDENKFLTLTEDLGFFVQKLYDMLPADQLKQYQRAYTAECLGRATTDQALSIAQTAASSNSQSGIAHHASNQLAARNSERSASTASSGPISFQKKYNQDSLTLNPEHRRALRSCIAKISIVQSASRTVTPVPLWVEWKSGSWDSGLRPVIETRIENLVILLSKIRTDSNDHLYRVLDCMGWFEDPRPNIYGIFYRLPLNTNPLASPISLKTRLQRKAPSLDVRIQLAKMLAVSLNEIHSSGWLHKNIQSSNILFFQDSTDSTDSAEKRDEVLLSKPYLVGFEISRPEADKRGTEPKTGENSSDQLQLTQHPSQSWTFSRREHDIYSLGLVLLEIGLWDTLDNLKLPEDTIADFHASIQSIADDLHADAGLAYREATKQCLALEQNVWIAAQSIFQPPDSNVGVTIDSNTSGAPPSEEAVQGRVLREFYFSVVDKLVRLDCHLHILELTKSISR
jgi:hypothetical protein